MNKRPFTVVTCVVLLIALVCGVITLGGTGYVLSVIVEAYNNLQQYTAQGGTCYASAMLPLAAAGLVIVRNKIRN